MTLDDGTEFELDHGAVVIAAITSCTNTSNPSVMIGAALLAKKAVERGLSRKPWVKTTLAPGSKVVMDYYEQAGLTPYLDKLGFNLVGYGCTTCIGNSGPLPEEISAAVNEHDLAVVSVLSGNRNFEGRINPDVKMNYLASPPLVVAYALAGTMDIDLDHRAARHRTRTATPVYLRDIWPTAGRGRARSSTRRSPRRCSPRDYADVFAGDERWQSLPTPDGDTFAWDADSTYVRKPPYFDGMPREPDAGHRHHRRPGAGQARRLGHHRPHLARPARSRRTRPAGQYLTEHGVEPRGLQLLRLAPRQPRGDDPRHVRQHPAAQPARCRAPRAASPVDLPRPASRRTIYDASVALRRRPASRWSSSPARSTAPARRATGRPRAPRCSASGRSSPSRTSGSTART